MATKPRHGARVVLPALAVLALAGAALAAEPTTQPATRPAVKITVGRDTTYLTGPLNADGTVNYVAAMNARLSKGVTPANNAAIGLLRAMGPDALPAEVSQRTLKRLGTEAFDPKSEYFVPLMDYAEAHAAEAEPAPTTAPAQKLDPDLAKAIADSDAIPPDLKREMLSPEGPSLAERRADEPLDKAMAGPWRAEQLPVIAGWLKANSAPLAIVTAASRLPRYYVPLVSTADPPQMVDCLLPSMHLLQDAARALACRAGLRLTEGDVSGARADALTIHRLGRLVAQSRGLICYLLGGAIDRVACGADTVIIGSGRLTAADAKAHLAALRALRPLPDVVDVIDESERFCLLDAVTAIARGGTNPAAVQGGQGGLAGVMLLGVDWNTVLRIVNRHFSAMVATHRVKDPKARKAAVTKYEQMLEQEFRSFLQWRKKGVLDRMADRLLGKGPPPRTHSEIVGMYLLALLMPSLADVDDLDQGFRQRDELVQIGLALTIYKAQHGGHPESLSALAPAYLPAVPVDRFTGEALRYSRDGKGFRLVSPGPDAEEADDDIVVEVGQRSP